MILMMLITIDYLLLLPAQCLTVAPESTFQRQIVVDESEA